MSMGEVGFDILMYLPCFGIDIRPGLYPKDTVSLLERD